MALLGSNMSSEVGLRLLLCPLGSNIVVRTACCSVGIALPVYSTFKAIESNDQNEQKKWLLYWAAYGSFSLAEVFADKILSWIVSFLLFQYGYAKLLEAFAWPNECPLSVCFLRVPLYYHMKFAFFVWLQLPSVDGARHLYMNHIRPFLLKHQSRLDQYVGFAYGEMVKFISAHQAEIHFTRTMFMKIVASANQMLRDVFHPLQPQGRRAIEGPTSRVQEPESDHED